MAEKENQIANWVRLCVCRAGSQLKRDEINEHVFNKEGIRHFSEMFLKVQTELRENFGLEMVPVPSRGTKQNSNAYFIQSSILNERRLPFIAQERSNGKFSLHLTGLLYLLLAILYTQGGELMNDSLAKYLQRFGLSMEKGGRSSAFGKDLMDALNTFVKQGYLEKSKTKEDDGSDSLKWSWGPRANAEIGKSGVEKWILEIYGDDANEDLRRDLVEAGTAQ